MREGIGKFCEMAHRALGDRCKVIDYSDLDKEAIYTVADFFNISLPPPTASTFRQAFLEYSKDPQGRGTFESESETKRRQATDVVRCAARQWAEPQYDALRHSEWVLTSTQRNA